MGLCKGMRRSVVGLAVAACLGLVGCLPPADPPKVREVMGYALTGHVSTPDLLTDIDRGLLTTVCVHAAYPDTAGKLTGFTPSSPALKAFVDKCHAAGARVVLSVASFSKTTIKAVLDSAQDALAKSIEDAVVAAGLDGASMDLEEVADTIAARDQYTSLCGKVADRMHASGRKLYIAVHPVVYTRYDGAALAALSDGLFLMGYGFHWSGGSTAGPLAPLSTGGFWSLAYDNKIFSTTVSNSWRHVVTDPGKLILGVPWYGQKWPTESATPGAKTTGAGKALSFRYEISGKYAGHWDSASKTPYATGADAAGTYQLWYDDETSNGLKFDAAETHKFQGIGMWRLPWGTEGVWDKVKRYKDGVVGP